MKGLNDPVTSLQYEHASSAIAASFGPHVSTARAGAASRFWSAVSSHCFTGSAAMQQHSSSGQNSSA